MAEPIPLSQRPGDMALAAFFALNVLAITYMEGFEQLVIADPDHFEYPVWPPRFMVDAVHWWGRTYDPLLMARPTWWRVIIAIDATFFGPFYVCAVYAFVKGREWIRIPSIIWASVMLTMVAVILGEEAFGEYATPQLGIVLFANALWGLVPIIVLFRMIRRPHPFAAEAVARDGMGAAGEVAP